MFHGEQTEGNDSAEQGLQGESQISGTEQGELGVHGDEQMSGTEHGLHGLLKLQGDPMEPHGGQQLPQARTKPLFDAIDWFDAIDLKFYKIKSDNKIWNWCDKILKIQESRVSSESKTREWLNGKCTGPL